MRYVHKVFSVDKTRKSCMKPGLVSMERARATFAQSCFSPQPADQKINLYKLVLVLTADV